MIFLAVILFYLILLLSGLNPNIAGKARFFKGHTMKLNTACLLLFCSYMVTIQVSTESTEIEDKYQILNNPPKVLQQLQEIYNIPFKMFQLRHRLLQLQNKLNTNYDSYYRGKRPFFLQAIPKPNSAAPLKRMSPPLKRIVCNRGKDSNCKYLFTFLNRS